MKIETLLREKLQRELMPTEMEIVNESPKHGLPVEAEKHFRVVMVSDRFAGLSRIERHRLVHAAVAVELENHVHALSVQAFTPEEFKGKSFSTPECLGGTVWKP